jgi:hypothetical protein
MTTKTTTTTTEAMSLVMGKLDDLVNDYDFANSRYRRDAFVRDGANTLLRQLAPIEADIFDYVTPTNSTRERALVLLMALEGGLSATDNRTYAVDRARVTPLIEDMLRTIVLGRVKFETEGD